MTAYRPFFRELDLEVLGILECGLLSRSLLDSELHTKVGKKTGDLRFVRCIVRRRQFHFILFKVREDVLLGPGELVFLLEDMLYKLEFSLTAATARRAPFFKVLGTANTQNTVIKTK